MIRQDNISFLLSFINYGCLFTVILWDVIIVEDGQEDEENYRELERGKERKWERERERKCETERERERKRNKAGNSKRIQVGRRVMIDM